MTLISIAVLALFVVVWVTGYIWWRIEQRRIFRQREVRRRRRDAFNRCPCGLQGCHQRRDWELYLQKSERERISQIKSFSNAGCYP